MTVAQLIEELKEFGLDSEVVASGYSWIGVNEPERYVSEPFVTKEEGKVVISA